MSRIMYLKCFHCERFEAVDIEESDKIIASGEVPEKHQKMFKHVEDVHGKRPAVEVVSERRLEMRKQEDAKRFGYSKQAILQMSMSKE